MNCKPGNLAIVVSVDGNPDLKHLINQIREVVAVETAWDGPAWTYKGERFRARGQTCRAIPDRWLRPINPPAGTVTDDEVRHLFEPGPAVGQRELV